MSDNRHQIPAVFRGFLFVLKTTIFLKLMTFFCVFWNKMSQIWTKKIPIKATENCNKIIGTLKKFYGPVLVQQLLIFCPYNGQMFLWHKSYHQHTQSLTRGIYCAGTRQKSILFIQAPNFNPPSIGGGYGIPPL